jgi:hypothetical protein
MFSWGNGDKFALIETCPNLSSQVKLQDVKLEIENYGDGIITKISTTNIEEINSSIIQTLLKELIFKIKYGIKLCKVRKLDI